MQVGYSGYGGAPRYLCGRGTHLYGTPPCQSTGRGAPAPRRARATVPGAASRPSLQATAQSAGRRRAATTASQVAAFELAAERARFEAGRALRKRDEVEPEQPAGRPDPGGPARRTPGRRRASAEADLAAARARHPVPLTGEELAWLQQAGADVRAVFDAPATTNSQRKQLIRAVISEITLTIDRPAADLADALIALAGHGDHRRSPSPAPTRGAGAHPRTSRGHRRPGPAPGRRTTTTPPSRRSWAASTRRTATGLACTQQPGQRPAPLPRHPRTARPRPRMSEPPARGWPPWSPSRRPQQLLGVGKVTIYRWLRHGLHHRRAAHPRRPWHIRVDQAPPRPHPARRPRRLAAPRPGRQTPSAWPARPCCTGPASSRSPRHPRTPQRPAYPGRTRTPWTVPHHTKRKAQC